MKENLVLRPAFRSESILRKPNLEYVDCSDGAWKINEYDICLENIDTDELEKIGSLETYTLNLDFMRGYYGNVHNAIVSAFEDAPSMNITPYFKYLFTSTGKLKKKFTEDIDNAFLEMFVGMIHILGRITIDEKFRGNGLAKTATEVYFHNMVRNSDIVFLLAYPLQHEGNKVPAKDQKSLNSYYEKIGFPCVENTNYFFGTGERFTVGMNKAA